MSESITRQNKERTSSTRSSSRSSKAAYLLFLVPALCCGLPLMVALLATVGALARGVAAGAVVALMGVAVILVVRRRSRANVACCEPVRPVIHSSPAKPQHHRQ